MYVWAQMLVDVGVPPYRSGQFHVYKPSTQGPRDSQGLVSGVDDVPDYDLSFDPFHDPRHEAGCDRGNEEGRFKSGL